MSSIQVKQLALNEGDLSFSSLFGDKLKKHDVDGWNEKQQRDSKDPWSMEPDDQFSKMFTVSTKKQPVRV